MKTNTTAKIPVSYVHAGWARVVSRASTPVRLQNGWSWMSWLRTDLNLPENVA